MFERLNILRSYLNEKYFMRFTDRKSLEHHQAIQFERFKRDVLSKSPYFSAELNKPLHDFPIMDKAIMMENFNTINTVGINKKQALSVAQKAEESRDFSPEINGITVGMSTGTSGTRGMFLVSPKERYQWAGIMLAKMLPDGIFTGQRIAFFLRANSNLYDTVSQKGWINFRFFDLAQQVEDHFKTLTEYRPTIIIAPAQVLRLFADAQNSGEIQVNPKRIISVAEVLYEDDKEKIQSAFGQIVHQIYQCTEGFLGATCSHGRLHLNEAYLYIEPDWIDDSREYFMPIITDLNRSTQPVVRYRLNDILTIDPSPCLCGSSELSLVRIEGRSDDNLRLFSPDQKKTVRIMPDFITRALAGAGGTIEDFRVYQVDAETLKVQLKAINQSSAQQAAGTALQNLFRKNKVTAPSITFSQLEQIDLMQKKRRVVYAVSKKGEL